MAASKGLQVLRDRAVTVLGRILFYSVPPVLTRVPIASY